jgi:hypothetical protein
MTYQRSKADTKNPPCRCRREVRIEDEIQGSPIAKSDVSVMSSCDSDGAGLLGAIAAAFAFVGLCGWFHCYRVRHRSPPQHGAALRAWYFCSVWQTMPSDALVRAATTRPPRLVSTIAWLRRSRERDRPLCWGAPDWHPLLPPDASLNPHNALPILICV